MTSSRDGGRQLRRLAAEGRTILISSHILSELEEVVDDAVFLVEGATVSSDRVAAAATVPATGRCCAIWKTRACGRKAITSPPGTNMSATTCAAPSRMPR